MKKILKHILYYILEIIEKYEYRNLSLDENDISKKIINTYDVNYDVLSDTGYVNATHLHNTQPYRVYEVNTTNTHLECADKHIVFLSDYTEVFVKDLKIGDYIWTEYGLEEVISVIKTKHKLSMCDLSINHENHRYYTNNVLSHNTISSSIFILYMAIFNRDQNILIYANKNETVKEVINKIKDIYVNLPFWLQPGVSNYNESKITFEDTKCKIKTVAGKNPGIGSSINLLYIDEAAYIENFEDMYRSIYPTVSSFGNSKIILTSTPNGYNLFWKLLYQSQLPKGHKDKNNYVSKMVYWYNVQGRFVTYLRLNEYELEKIGLTAETFLSYLIETYKFDMEVLDEKGFIAKEGIKLVRNFNTDKVEIHIPSSDRYLPNDIKAQCDALNSENPLSDWFRRQVYTRIKTYENEQVEVKTKFIDICEISSWKEDAISDIGSIEAFNQEYDLQFMSGAKMVLDSVTMARIEKSLEKYENVYIQQLSRKPHIGYDELEFMISNPELFDIKNAKDYYMVFSVDLSEGLNGDYSVINMFRIMLKSEDELPVKITSVVDFFKIVQVGVYQCNTIAVPDLAEILYILCFEVFDDNKIGVVLEVNAFGGELLLAMRTYLDGNNMYGTHIFFRYKHRIDAIKPEIGIKLRQNKNMFVKDYQKRVRGGDISITHTLTMQEMTKFIKKENSNGNVSYSADSGANDDLVITVVESSTVFENNKFKEMCEDIIQNKLNNQQRQWIEEKMKLSPSIVGSDYSVLNNVQSRIRTTSSFGGGYNNGYSNSFGF
jgi:hypothetical protein